MTASGSLVQWPAAEGEERRISIFGTRIFLFVLVRRICDMVCEFSSSNGPSYVVLVELHILVRRIE